MQLCLCAEVTQASLTAAAPLTDDNQAAAMNLAVLIVVPIFLACYAGSCIAYIIYKIHRNCRRRPSKSHVAGLDSMETPAAPAVRAPAAFPAYLPAPGQPLPPPAITDGSSGCTKAPASYETPPDRAENVPISEILMKKMAQKPMASAY